MKQNIKKRNSIMGAIYLVLYIVACFVSCKDEKSFVIYNYKILDYKEIYANEPIYKDTAVVGSLISINYDTIQKKCYGQLKLDKKLKVTSKTLFIHEEPLIDFPVIRILPNGGTSGRALDNDIDTIQIFRRKVKFRMESH